VNLAISVRSTTTAGMGHHDPPGHRRRVEPDRPANPTANPVTIPLLNLCPSSERWTGKE
jgi:hypothetical protein